MKRKKTHLLLRDGPDPPDWDGIAIESVDVGCHTKLYPFGGVYYCTYGEVTLARMLTERGVPFTPNVRITIVRGAGLGAPKKIYVPDFIFNRETWIWTDDEGDKTFETPTHGLEAKSSSKEPSKVRLLYERRGIRVIVLSEVEIDWYAQNGGLPLKRGA